MFCRAFVTESVKVIETSGMRGKCNTLRESIREREKEYGIWLGGVNGEIKIVITRTGILSSD